VLKSVHAKLLKYARSSGPLLILGESGTGKELAAHAVHALGPRKGRNFVAVNCGAIPDNLLESELFGHARGAFTGATQDRRGKFEVADRGTIFLDEIGNTSASMQAKLLRVLDEGEFCRLGDNRTFKVNVRIVSATNLDLELAVKEGRFREDLYYRLRVHRITLPPLRCRDGDIPLLIQYYLARFAAENNKVGLKISTEAMSCLVRYLYPGNIRELAAIIEDAVVLADGPAIKIEDLPAEVLGGRSEGATIVPSVAVSSTGGLSDVESAHTESVLRRTGWNKTLAAKELGIPRSRLYRIISKHKLAPVSVPK
jgi:transcriptional regulator with PAS, ATPase and Fis domain